MRFSLCFNTKKYENVHTTHKPNGCWRDEEKHSTTVYNERLCIKCSWIFAQSKTKSQKKRVKYNAWVHFAIHSLFRPHHQKSSWEMNKWTRCNTKNMEIILQKGSKSYTYKSATSSHTLTVCSAQAHICKFMVETCKQLYERGKELYGIHITSPHFHISLALLLLVCFESNILTTTVTAMQAITVYLWNLNGITNLELYSKLWLMKTNFQE